MNKNPNRTTVTEETVNTVAGRYGYNYPYGTIHSSEKLCYSANTSALFHVLRWLGVDNWTLMDRDGLLFLVNGALEVKSAPGFRTPEDRMFQGVEMKYNGNGEPSHYRDWFADLSICDAIRRMTTPDQVEIITEAERVKRAKESEKCSPFSFDERVRKILEEDAKRWAEVGTIIIAELHKLRKEAEKKRMEKLRVAMTPVYEELFRQCFPDMKGFKLEWIDPNSMLPTKTLTKEEWEKMGLDQIIPYRLVNPNAKPEPADLTVRESREYLESVIAGKESPIDEVLVNAGDSVKEESGMTLGHTMKYPTRTEQVQVTIPDLVESKPLKPLFVKCRISPLNRTGTPHTWTVRWIKGQRPDLESSPPWSSGVCETSTKEAAVAWAAVNGFDGWYDGESSNTVIGFPVKFGTEKRS